MFHPKQGSDEVVMKALRRLKFLTVPLLVGCLFPASGCATLTHKERVGQPEEERGEIDWYAVTPQLILPGGSIGVAVDFLSGAAYKPKSESDEPEPEPEESP